MKTPEQIKALRETTITRICDKITEQLYVEVKAGFDSIDVNIGEFVENEKIMDVLLEKVQSVLVARGFKIVEPVFKDFESDFAVTVENLIKIDKL